MQKLTLLPPPPGLCKGFFGRSRQGARFRTKRWVKRRNVSRIGCILFHGGRESEFFSRTCALAAHFNLREKRGSFWCGFARRGAGTDEKGRIARPATFRNGIATNCNGMQQSCNIEFGQNPTPCGRQRGIGEDASNKLSKGCGVMQNVAAPARREMIHDTCPPAYHLSFCIFCGESRVSEEIHERIVLEKIQVEVCEDSGALR